MTKSRLLLSSALVALIFLTMSIGLTAARSNAAPDDSSKLGKLVYVDAGDLWTKQLPDGEPRRLTNDGLSFAPQWSPSGNWITYRRFVAKNTEAWVIGTNGSHLRQLDAVYQSVNTTRMWSPTEDQLALITAKGDLIVESADGAVHAVLVQLDASNSHDQISDPLWSPDGLSIAYARRSRPNYEALWRVDVPSGQATELYSYLPPNGQIIPAKWTPDSKQVYFWRSPVYSASIMADGLELYAVSSSGGAVQALGRSSLLYDDYFSFSPAGSSLAITIGGGRDTYMRKTLSVIDTSGGLNVRTFSSPVDVATGSLAWSPDGSQIAYGEQPVGGIDPNTVQGRRIWLINADGSNNKRLTLSESMEDRPQWSVDGKSLLYVEPDFGGDGGLGFSPSPRTVSLVLFTLVDGSKKTAIADLGLPDGNDLQRLFGYYGHFDWGKIFDWWQAP